MKITNYVQILTAEDKVKIDFTKNRGNIIKFVIQYYALVDSRWRTIMRIDNYHGIIHKHVYHASKIEYNFIIDGENNEVFTEMKRYVIREFIKIKSNFLNIK